MPDLPDTFEQGVWVGFWIGVCVAVVCFVVGSALV